VLFAELVDASNRVAATSKRSEKVAVLAELLHTTSPDEVDAVVGLLTGEPRQGRLGVGWATIAGLQVEPANERSLTIHDVDAALARVAAMHGGGSQRERTRAMSALWERATNGEQHHLYGVLTGELRQGANEGVVADAVAKASAHPIAAVRRAAMLLGDLGAAARLALSGQSLDVG
jgi:DNA ligase 1